MNEQNLIPLNRLSETERKKIARAGGKASGKSRKEKANFKKVVQTILSADFFDKEAKKTLTGYEAITIQMFRKALQGDRGACEFLRDTAGESPKDKKQQEQGTQEKRRIVFEVVKKNYAKEFLEKFKQEQEAGE